MSFYVKNHFTEEETQAALVFLYVSVLCLSVIKLVIMSKCDNQKRPENSQMLNG